MLKLLDAAIFQALIGNADAQNYSLLHNEEAIELAPLYDLLSTVAYPELSSGFAMKIAGRGTLPEIRTDDWSRFANSAGVSAPFAKRRVRELAGLAIERAGDAAEELAVPGMDALAGFAERVRNRARQLERTVR